MRRFFSGRRLLVVASALVAVFAVVAAFHDLPAVVRALQTFDWRMVPAASVMAVGMHLLRFARWHLYARRVAGETLRFRDSLHIYGAGLGTHLTPGRMGEAVRCAFLQRSAGTPVARSAPIMLAERVMDGVGLLGLALPGAVFLHLGGRLAPLLLLAPLPIAPLLANRWLHTLALRAAARAPLLRRSIIPLRHASEELRAFMALRVLVPAAALSLAAMALEVASFALILAGAGVSLNAESLTRAAFVLPAAMLATAVFLVPGNLGVAEGGLAVLTRISFALPAGAAAGVAVLARFCTLWLGLLVGFVALAIAVRRWGGRPAAMMPAPGRTGEGCVSTPVRS